MYSLRSRPRGQTSIPFPQRKRRQEDCLKVPGLDGREETSPSKSPRREKPLTRSAAKRASKARVGAPRSENKPPSSPVSKLALSPKVDARSPLRESNTRLTAVTTPEGNRLEAREFTPTPPKSRIKAEGAVKRLTFPQPLKPTNQPLPPVPPSALLCREEQLDALASFLRKHLLGEKPGALYISGAPGTGKTACLMHTLEHREDLLSSARVVVINCMSIKSPRAIFSRLSSELLPPKAARRKDMEEALVKHITSFKKMILIVLDELDQLDSHSQQVLYQLFEWPTLPRSKLVVVGIANALDLTDRLLPRLQAHSRCQPSLLHMPPYTRDQIVAILRARQWGGGETLLELPAIMFCARKVSAVHGDLRLAVDICRRAADLVNTQRCSQPSTSPGPTRVTLPVMASVFSACGSSVSAATPTTLPFQQKLIVCTLVAMVRGRAVKEVTVGALMATYSRVCERRQLRAEQEVEFMALTDALEARGIIAVKRVKEARMNKVCLKLQLGEVEHALQDSALLASVMSHQDQG